MILINSHFFFGPDTGGHHIQLFVKTKNRQRYTAITRRLGVRPDQIHFEAVTFTPEKSWDYCGEDKDEEEGAITRHGCASWKFGERYDVRFTSVWTRYQTTIM